MGGTYNGNEGKAMTHEITLITRDGCQFCVRGKKVLAEAGFPYIEKRIGPDITRDEVLQQYPGKKMLPFFILDGEYIGSYDELYDWVTDEINKKETHTGGCPVN